MTDQEIEFKTIVNTIQEQAKKLIDDYRKDYPNDQTFLLINLTSDQCNKTGLIVDAQMSLDKVGGVLVNLNERLMEDVIKSG